MTDMVISPPDLLPLAGITNTLPRVAPPLTFASGLNELPIFPAVASGQVDEDAVWAARGNAIMARIEAGVEETVPWDQVKAELGL